MRRNNFYGKDMKNGKKRGMLINLKTLLNIDLKCQK